MHSDVCGTKERGEAAMATVSTLSCLHQSRYNTPWPHLHTEIDIFNAVTAGVSDVKPHGDTALARGAWAQGKEGEGIA